MCVSFDVDPVVPACPQAGPSSPPARLVWFMNSERAAGRDLPPHFPLGDGRAVARSMLARPAPPASATLRCVAVISKLYRSAQ